MPARLGLRVLFDDMASHVQQGAVVLRRAGTETPVRDLADLEAFLAGEPLPSVTERMASPSRLAEIEERLGRVRGYAAQDSVLA